MFDEQGERIRGSENGDRAEHAPACVKLSGEMNAAVAVAEPDQKLARVCSEYLQYFERSVTAGSMSGS